MRKKPKISTVRVFKVFYKFFYREKKWKNSVEATILKRQKIYNLAFVFALSLKKPLHPQKQD